MEIHWLEFVIKRRACYIYLNAEGKKPAVRKKLKLYKVCHYWNGPQARE